MRYRGLWSSLVRIAREEGVRALWKGHVPAQALSVVYGTAQFSTYECVNIWLRHSMYPSQNVSSSLVAVLAGGCAGVVATSLSHPVDVVRTRLVAQGEPRRFSSIYSVCRHMCVCEGLSSFLRGFTPAVLLTSPYTALQFGAFSVCSRLCTLIPLMEEKPGSRALCAGFMAGLLSKTAVYPLDVIKKRMQIQGFDAGTSNFGKVRVYSSWVQCVRVTVGEEGWRGLYRGLAASTVKSAVTTALHFCFYEMCLHALMTSSHVSSRSGRSYL